MIDKNCPGFETSVLNVLDYLNPLLSSHGGLLSTDGISRVWQTFFFFFFPLCILAEYQNILTRQEVKLATVVEGDQKAPFSIATNRQEVEHFNPSLKLNKWIFSWHW